MQSTNEALAMDAVRLLSGMSDSMGTSLQASSRDITQAVSLLNQAVDQLTQQFLSINHDIGLLEQQSQATATDTSSALLSNCQQKIRQVVTTLQFHDIASQLLTRTEGRLAGMQRILAQASPTPYLLSAHPMDAEEMDVTAYLQDLNRLLTNYNSDLQTCFSGAIKQTHLSSGEIELF